MIANRIIPTLLIRDGMLVKTQQFKNPRYIGDPINAVKIFNQKEVDELVILDICATKYNNDPDYSAIEAIASEAFMPIGYGGGIKNLHQMERLFKLGVEKVIMNNSAFTDEGIIYEASKVFGSQSIVVSVDIKKDIIGNHKIYINSGKHKLSNDIVSTMHKFEQLGAGEIIINSIDRDGTMRGYDLRLLSTVSKNLSIPVIALGGAGCVDDFVSAIKSGASGVAAGSLFVYHGVHKAVLISYVKSDEVASIMSV